MKGRSRELRATTRRSGTGRGALVAGLVVGSAYVLVVAAGSWLHAGLGVPLLDGFAPPVAYRWVSPPPSLAAGNQPPVAQRFTITMGKRGSDPQVISTIDLQATLVLNSAEIPPRTGSTPVELDVTPLAASDVGRLPGVLVVAGNVYRFTAQYKGDGKVGPLRRPTPVTLVYPATPATGHVEHAVVWSSDGHAWKKLETRDSRKGQMALASIEAFGYVAVAIPASAADGLVQSPAPTPPRSSGTSTVSIVAIAAASVLAVAAIVVLLVRRRRYRGFHRRNS